MGDALITIPMPEFIHEPQPGEKRVPNAPSQTHTLKPRTLNSAVRIFGSIVVCVIRIVWRLGASASLNMSRGRTKQKRAQEQIFMLVIDHFLMNSQPGARRPRSPAATFVSRASAARRAHRWACEPPRELGRLWRCLISRAEQPWNASTLNDAQYSSRR